MIREAVRPKHRELLAEYGLRDVPEEALVYLKYKKREFICQVEDPIPYFMIVTEGRVKVTNILAGGKNYVVCFYQKGGLMGDMELLTGRTASSQVQAITDVEIVGVSIELYGEAMRNNVAFLNKIAAGLVEKLYNSSYNSTCNLLIPLEYRLCKFIQEMEEDGCFSDNLTVLAEMFGCSYRHLGRMVKRLCEEGVLARRGRDLLITDERMLNEYASHCE